MQTDTGSKAPAERIFIEAIARKRLITATYNGSPMKLAPHQLFTRHGDLFVSALNTGKNWREDDEMRLGHFKLVGLSDVEITGNSFEPLQTFDGSTPKEGDTQLFSV